MTKAQRVVELLVSGALLTGYIAFIIPNLPGLPLGEQYLINLIFLSGGLIVSWLLIRSLRNKQTKQIGSMTPLGQSLLALTAISGGVLWAAYANLLGPYGLPGDNLHLLLLISVFFFTYLIFLYIVVRRKAKLIG